jgi:hypothetical protein
MNIAKRPFARLLAILFVLLFTHFFIAGHAGATWVRGTFSNFDLHNFTEEPVNDLELTLGGIGINDIVRLYAGAHARGWSPYVEAGEQEVIIFWKAPDGSYLKPCEWLHLGLSLRAGAPFVEYAKATWIADGKPVGTIAFVWQNWVADPEGVVDIIIPPAEFPVVSPTGGADVLVVERRWAPSRTIIPLNNLTQDDPMVASLKWSEEPKVDKLTPDSPPSEMLLESPGGDIAAVLVRYTVTLESTKEVEAVFINEARIVHDPGPRPKMLRPVDNLGERPNLIYGVVNLWATETTGLWDDQVVAARFEFSGDGGRSWNVIGEDDDGTVPSYSTTERTSQHNWWGLPWDVSDYTEGEYLVKTTMWDRKQNVGMDVIDVYIDPTPPMPVLDNLRDHQVFMVPTEISCRTLDDDIVSVVWEVQFKLAYYTKGIPPLDQHDYGVGQTNNGNMYCAPTGSAACLKWWADHGYTKLTQDGGGNPLTNTQLVEGLATAMGTSSTGGTSGTGIVNGLREWVNDRYLLMTVTEHATINPTTIRNEVENCKEDVILGILWNTGGGHIVTVNSIANYTNADGTTTIGVMDPWIGGTVTLTMESDGDIHWPGKGGVQASGLLVTVSPLKLVAIPIPWLVIGQDRSVVLYPSELQPGLYFLRATMTDSKGNKCSSQIVARVGQPLLPPVLRGVSVGAEGTMNLEWQETEPGEYGYTVEYCDDLAEGNWKEAEPDGLWPIPDTFWSGDNVAGRHHRYYRVMKDYGPR